MMPQDRYRKRSAHEFKFVYGSEDPKKTDSDYQWGDDDKLRITWLVEYQGNRILVEMDAKTEAQPYRATSPALLDSGVQLGDYGDNIFEALNKIADRLDNLGLQKAHIENIAYAMNIKFKDKTKDEGADDGIWGRLLKTGEEIASLCNFQKISTHSEQIVLYQRGKTKIFFDGRDRWNPFRAEIDNESYLIKVDTPADTNIVLYNESQDPVLDGSMDAVTPEKVVFYLIVNFEHVMWFPQDGGVSSNFSVLEEYLIDGDYQRFHTNAIDYLITHGVDSMMVDKEWSVVAIGDSESLFNASLGGKELTCIDLKPL